MRAFHVLSAFVAYACAATAAPTTIDDYTDSGREDYVNLAMCRLRCMEPLPRSCNYSSVDACTSACNYCWQLCQYDYTARKKQARTTVKVPAKRVTDDAYVIPGLPRLDTNTRELEWERLIKIGSSTEYKFVDVGCMEPVLYVVFWGRRSEHNDPAASLDQQSRFHDFMMQTDVSHLTLRGVPIDPRDGRSVLFRILAVTAKAGVVATTEYEYSLPEENSVVREYRGSIWRSSWTDDIVLWGLVTTCAIVLVFGVVHLLSHIIRERPGRRPHMMSNVLTWGPASSSRAYDETAL